MIAARRIRSEMASDVFRRDSWATTSGGLNEFAEPVGIRPKLTRCTQEVGQSSQRVIPSPLMERSMSEEIAKTDADYVRDTLAQLKEMQHYSKNNIEVLSGAWMLFEDKLSGLKRTEQLGDLMDRQGQLHDAREAMINDLEGVLEKMQPDPPEE